ncbi:GGDEF domain-containing protein [Pseudomonas mangiferae]|uniref:diguanylate cyclase n=1 Tax=Pseudomonas mangiferae TaxID=2593654 RepID=A0A553H0I1_9PSED|nr:diguanylate cyclase [Pseudomonas mangiferae]TRX75265.1 diguanylate cyclase [Pseudomonas mangiferae]
MKNTIITSTLCSGTKRLLDLPSASNSMRVAALIEVEGRAFLGAFVYLPCWVGISISTGVAGSAPGYAACITALLSVVVAFRVVLHFHLRRLIEYSERIARLALLILVLGLGLIMGIVATLAAHDAGLRPIFYSVVVVCGVLCTGGMSILSIDPAIRYGMPIVMFGPLLFGFAAEPTTLNITLSILLLVNVAYLFATSRRVQLDYWDGAPLKEMLKEQAAQFERQSLTDGLTQIPNRLNATQHLSGEWSRSLREGLPLTIMIVDIDHFKSINDKYGHLFGDKCLIAVANTLKTIIREPDFVARYGGEEFIVALNKTTEEQALRSGKGLEKRLPVWTWSFRSRG